MTVITRFAPSPTGYLHIGGARTALFNYLFAKNRQGKFLLRIEDTDQQRSTDSAKEAILSSLKWLELNWDDEIIYQSTRSARHVEIAEELLSKGKAYYCFSSQEEIARLRNRAISDKKHFIFHSPWRDKTSKDYPSDIKPVIRLKAPREGETIVRDLLQGNVVVQNSHLDDMVLVRSDNTPTYMLAVVVDDHDMGVTHIIRGDDHLNNASRQQLIYQALDWRIPEMTHIPLIHGPDGAKLSKRHGALGVESYKDMGYLPEALCNYLLRLGWSHGDDEIIDRKQAIERFNINGLGKSAARLDFDKMKHLNSIYLRAKNNEELVGLIYEHFGDNLSDDSKRYIFAGLNAIKARSSLLTDVFKLAEIYITDHALSFSPEAKEVIRKTDKNLIDRVIKQIELITDFNKESVKDALEKVALNNSLEIGKLMQHVRAYITGRINSPSVFEIMAIIGKNHSLNRLKREFKYDD